MSNNISSYILGLIYRQNQGNDISNFMSENIFLKSCLTNKPEDVRRCYEKIGEILCQLTESNFCIIINYNERQKLQNMCQTAHLYHTPAQKNALDINSIFPIIEPYLYEIIETNAIVIDNAVQYSNEIKNVCFIPLLLQNHLYLIVGIANKMVGEYCLTHKKKLSSLWVLVTNLVQLMQIFQKSIECKKQQLLDSREMFLANISHEIRTPLNAITGMTELLLCSDSLSNLHQKYLETIQDCGNQLLGLINDILDYSKIAANKIVLKYDEFNLLNLVDKCMEIISLDATKKKLILHKKIHPSVPQYLIGDEKRIKQVLLNILWNAVKFTNNGSITIDVGTMPLHNNNVSLQRKNTSNGSSFINVVFAIRDTGIGIQEDKLMTIFDLFGQVEQNGPVIQEGIGLGLAISKKLINLHKGEISVHSTVNEGSTFTFNFVLEQTLLNTDMFKNKSVLIIDEDSLNRLSYLQLFRKWDLISMIATNGNEVSLLLDMHRFDVILLDMDIRGEWNGLQIAKLIHNHSNSCSIIALYNDKSVFAKPPRFAFQLIKPIKKHDLYDALLGIFAHSNDQHNNDHQNNDDENEQQHEDNKDHQEDPKTKSALNILIAEDSKLNQLVLQEILKKLHFQNFDIANNGQEVLDKIVSKTYDILLLDIKMPIMDGYQTMLQLHQMIENQTLDKLPVIIAQTAHALETEKEKCIDLGFNDYLTKPFTINAISDIINKYCC